MAESSLAHTNGVTGSVRRVVHHLRDTGHRAMVIAPSSTSTGSGFADVAVESVPSLPFLGYPQVRVALPTVRRLAATLRRFEPDIVHLASPFLLGWQALLAADGLGIPAVAVYQTDVAAYARRYRLPATVELVERHVHRLHSRAALTLAPSTASMDQLDALGVSRVRRWARGVDTGQFRPDRRDEHWRRRIAPGERIIGYVGRLAPEKQLGDLRALHDLPSSRLVLVGEGPSRTTLEAMLPEAVFLGHLEGAELARAVASFDVFVHTGESETFGQTLQEALASGVPVVAPGVGGPVDIVRSSVNGWLYAPGDLGDLRAKVLDLLGDDAKRRAFGEAAPLGMRDRSWSSVCDALLGHYRDAIAAGPHPVARPVRRALTSR